MNSTDGLSLALGLVIFSFSISSLLIVPFINLLFKIKATRRKEALSNKKKMLFDEFHDIKAGTPLGGGILLIALVSLIFILIFPFASHMGVFIRSAFSFKSELSIIIFTFISFGILGLIDDYIKVFGKPHKGSLGIVFGMTRGMKFLLQWILAFMVATMLYFNLGIQFIHIPLINTTIKLGIFYIPFAAFIIVFFTNAYNITDGLDGLATGLLTICLLAFGVIAAGSLDTPMMTFIAIWLGALMAFLYFNIWPARIFLGDAGALSFGATLGLIGLITGSIFALFIIGGIFVIELISSAIQIYGWKKYNRPILPLAPLHNTFLTLGWEEPKVVTRAWLAGIMLAVFGLWLATI